MKLNAATEMIPVSWPEVSNIHPFAPLDQTQGYIDMIHSLHRDLAEITGFAAMSTQPNSGAQVRRAAAALAFVFAPLVAPYRCDMYNYTMLGNQFVTLACPLVCLSYRVSTRACCASARTTSREESRTATSA